MKTKILSLTTLVCLMLFSGCDKQDTKDADAETTGAADLEGTWELYQTSSGMSPLTTFPAGNGHLLQISADKYTRYHNGQVVFETTYQLVSDSVLDVNTCAMVPAKSSAPNQIVLATEPFLKTYFEVSGNTLKTTTGCIPADGGWSSYRKRQAAP